MLRIPSAPTATRRGPSRPVITAAVTGASAPRDLDPLKQFFKDMDAGLDYATAKQRFLKSGGNAAVGSGASTPYSPNPNPNGQPALPDSRTMGATTYATKDGKQVTMTGPGAELQRMRQQGGTTDRSFSGTGQQGQGGIPPQGGMPMMKPASPTAPPLPSQGQPLGRPPIGAPPSAIPPAPVGAPATSNTATLQPLPQNLRLVGPGLLVDDPSRYVKRPVAPGMPADFPSRAALGGAPSPPPGSPSAVPPTGQPPSKGGNLSQWTPDVQGKVTNALQVALRGGGDMAVIVAAVSKQFQVDPARVQQLYEFLKTQYR